MCDVYKNFDGVNYTLILKFDLPGSNGYTNIHSQLYDSINQAKLNFVKFDEQDINFNNFQSGFTYDVYGDNSMVPGFNIENIDDNQIGIYLSYLTTLPFPRYIQEFDTTGLLQNSDVNVNSIENLQSLFFSIPTWKQLGRWDIAWYLESIQEIINGPESEQFFGQNANQTIIELTYSNHYYEDEGGDVTYLSHAANNVLPFQSVFVYEDAVFTEVYNGIDSLAGELGESIGDCDLTNIKYYNKPKSIWEMFGFEENI